MDRSPAGAVVVKQPASSVKKQPASSVKRR